MARTISLCMRHHAWCLTVLAICGIVIDQAVSAEVDFQRQVLPILTENCSHCHGVDEETRAGGLRLDVRDSALAGGDSGKAAVVPGKPSESEIIRRMRSHDPDEQMPPPKENKVITEEQIAILERWIASGGEFEMHWAFTTPVKPTMSKEETLLNPVDVLAKRRLSSKGWTISEPATANQLCRRIYLDLIGIPPTPEEMIAFEKDRAAATIDRLLGDVRYGEKWARPWLDVARYSDTNGYEKDMPRQQWAWRDWVVSAIAADKPYDEFLIEQIAGDLLPNATQDNVISTGFLRNSMINEEGAIVPEQFRMVEMFDRMDCIGKSVLGVSLQCAQCHTHKFDPITHDDYYGVFAFLNDTYESQSWVYSSEQLGIIRDIRNKIESAEQKVVQEQPEWRDAVSKWANGLISERPKWHPLKANLLETISGLNHPVQEADDSILMLGHVSNDVFMLTSTELPIVTGLQMEMLTHGELPFRGPGRNGVGQWDLKELEVFVQRPGSIDWQKQRLVNASADFSQPEEKSADGKTASGPVAFIIDGKDETNWRSDRGVGRRNQASVAVVQFEQPLTDLKDAKLKIVWRMGDMIGSCRFSITDAPNPIAPSVDHETVLAITAGRLTDSRVVSSWIRTLPNVGGTLEAIEAEWRRFPIAATSVLHATQREPERSRPTYILERGNWDSPRRKVEPHVLASFHPTVAAQEPARLRFARWLADRRSPLTARVAVNRVWQSIFGQGLVETAEDFGLRTGVPEHQEILDYLAVDFMDHDWSQKHLIRTILNSSVYQQSSAATAEKLERDPKNRWLTRGPRFRADAEVVRDIALSISGLLTHKVGGPSVIPPVPQNVLDYNYTYPSYWKPAEGAERYRRSLYVFRKRSMPDPVMSVLDSPNGDLACARRPRSNTPLAALTGLNETIFVEAARGLALRVLRESKSTSDADRIDRAYLLCVSRMPNDRERAAVMHMLESHRKRIADGWLNPREILTGDPAKLVELPNGATPQDAAAWTLASRVLLNLDETVSKN